MKPEEAPSEKSSAMNPPETYKAYLVSKDEEGRASSSISNRSFNELPEGEVLIRVEYSSLNYKDALSATGSPGITKTYPHVPGVDAAGTVVESVSKSFSKGEKVLVTGYELGANADGGYAEYIRVPSDWVVPLPGGLTVRESMVYGTAGFTAALSVRVLQRNRVRPRDGEVVVTGATGGVGSIAVALLSKEGYDVVASTGKEDTHDFLKTLGAKTVIHRAELDEESNRPLLKARWAGAVDTVGGNTLSTLLRTTRIWGSVAACGLVGGNSLTLTVFPFILRGVNLLGIDSAWCPRDYRLETWRMIATRWKLDILDAISQTIRLEQLDEYVAMILKGKLRGRTTVAID